MVYKVYTDGVSKGEVSYGQDEFNSNDSGEWFCQNCNTGLPLTFEEGEKLFIELSKKEVIE